MSANSSVDSMLNIEVEEFSQGRDSEEENEFLSTKSQNVPSVDEPSSINFNPREDKELESLKSVAHTLKDDIENPL